tara:strand:- start:933 stop:1352 length:420 start_codon:yes stop_codon:yes gene_type:complete
LFFYALETVGNCTDELNDKSLAAARTNLCPSTARNIVSANTLLQYGVDASSSDRFCVNVAVNLEPADLFAQSKQASIALSFVKLPAIDNSFAVVRNDQSGVVGQIVGDGVLIEYDGPPGTEDQVNLKLEFKFLFIKIFL